MNRKEFVNIYKRFFIAFLCCIPIFVVIGIFLTKYIGNVWTVVIYCVIGAIAFVIAEVIHSKRQKKLEQRRAEAKLKRRYKNLQTNSVEPEKKSAKKNKADNKNKD